MSDRDLEGMPIGAVSCTSGVVAGDSVSARQSACDRPRHGSLVNLVSSLDMGHLCSKDMEHVPVAVASATWERLAPPQATYAPKRGARSCCLESAVALHEVDAEGPRVSLRACDVGEMLSLQAWK